MNNRCINVMPYAAFMLSRAFEMCRDGACKFTSIRNKTQQFADMEGGYEFR